MKTIIVTCYESNEERVKFITETFEERKDKVEIITTSFSHKLKKQRENYPCFLDKSVKIETIPYTRNLSIKRLYSHYRFAKDAFDYIEKRNPDLIWVVAPCNSLIKQANIYKKKHDETKVIIDMIDMWPESLPIKINKNVFPLSIWKNIRSKNINCSSILVTECDLYKNILKEEYSSTIETLQWCRDSKSIKTNCLNNDLSLCYIGSINNIIDIEKICIMISKLGKNITFHIIGDGEAREKLIKETSKICKVEYHGVVYDVEEKRNILRNCHAGINIYRDDLYIGLTVKSIDYLQFGLPIINNIKGDTWNLIKNYKIGFNINDVFTKEDIVDMRNNNNHIYDLFDNNFTKTVFISKCNRIIDEVVK